AEAVLVGLGAAGGAEQAVEDQARGDLLGERRRLGTPGQGGGGGAAVAGGAVGGLPPALAAEFERRGAGGGADAGGHGLVRGSAGADVGAVGLAGLAAGEEGGHGAGVVAGAVAVGAGLVAGQPGQDHQLIAERGERFEDVREGEVGALGGGRPLA